MLNKNIINLSTGGTIGWKRFQQRCAQNFNLAKLLQQDPELKQLDRYWKRLKPNDSSRTRKVYSYPSHWCNHKLLDGFVVPMTDTMSYSHHHWVLCQKI
jgi:hypothetical protein